MSDFGEPSYGQDAYGGSPNSGDPTITSVVVSVAGGPNITTTWVATQISDGLPQKTARLQYWAADLSVMYFDTGWSPNLVSSGLGSSFTIDATETGVPTDTGTGSVYPTLHLIVIVFSSPSATPDTEGWFNTASSAPFDIQWGVSSVRWGYGSTLQVPATGFTFNWVFSSTRGFTEGSYEAQLVSLDGGTVWWDSGVITGVGTSLTPDYTLTPDTSYRLIFIARNTNGVAAPELSTILITGTLAVPVGAPMGGQLQRFLSMVGFEFDITRSWLEQLRSVNDPKNVPGQLLPALANQLGVAYERSLGSAQTRKLLSNIVHEYKIKGTYLGIEGICTDLTGWSASVGCGPNILASSVVMSSGSMTGITASTINGLDNSAPPIPSGYGGTHAPTTWPTTVASDGKVISASYFYTTSTVTGWNPVFSSSPVAGSPSAYGVPISSDVHTVSFDAWVWFGSITSPPSILPSIVWYNAQGAVISTYSGIAGSSTNNAWNHVTANTVPVPAGTVWAVLNLTPLASPAMVAGSIVMVAVPSLTASTFVPTSFQHPRDLLIALSPDRTNLAVNPSMESGATTGWTTNGTEIAVNGTFFALLGVPNPGTRSLKVTATAAGNLTATTVTQLNPELQYTSSAYVRPNTIQRLATVTLQPLNASGTAVGLPVTSVGIAEQPGSWVRAVCSLVPGYEMPPTATQLRTTITFVGVASGESHYIDAVLIEDGWYAQPYFDGAVYQGQPVGADYFWTTTLTGPSYYYQNYATKLSRLAAVLSGKAPPGESSPMSITGFIPFGCTYTLSTLGTH
jgi:phage tail-like protein